jgi:pimeloyl-ACP methyl ester carboxylesterase
VSGAVRTIRRAFVTVGDGQLHYRRAGAGPAVVLVHEPPRSSQSLSPLLGALADRFCVVAPDVPGYGASDPLPVEEPTIADYAEALVLALDALRLDVVGLYGTHGGAAIALELARRAPYRVRALVLDGLELYTHEERRDLLVHDVVDVEPRIDGTHVMALWTRIRDGYIFSPWYRREAAARRHIDLPSAALLHEDVMDLLRAGRAYGAARTALFRYSPEQAIETLSVPAMLIYRDDDVSEGHARRCPELPSQVQLVRAPAAGELAVERVGAFLRARPAPPAPPPPAVATRSDRLTRDYADTPSGQLLVRRAGAGADVPLLMLHASPGSAEMLVDLISALAREGRSVIALDTLGNGESDKPPWDVAEVDDYAPVVLAAADSLGLARFDLYGSHTGAHIAAEVGILSAERVRRLVLDGLAMYPREHRRWLLEHYTPPLEPRDDGTHLMWAWGFMRDMTLFYPWFHHTIDGIVDREPMGADQLTIWFVETLKSGHTYPIAYRAVFRHRLRERLPLLRTQTLMVAKHSDRLSALTFEAASLAPDAKPLALSEDVSGAARAIAAFLASG